MNLVVACGPRTSAGIFTDLEVYAPLAWAMIGLAFCTVVGLVAGMWPAVPADAHRGAAARVKEKGGTRLVPPEILRFADQSFTSKSLTPRTK